MHYGGADMPFSLAHFAWCSHCDITAYHGDVSTVSWKVGSNN